jgi:hypothetical protein
MHSIAEGTALISPSLFYLLGTCFSVTHEFPSYL